MSKRVKRMMSKEKRSRGGNSERMEREERAQKRRIIEKWEQDNTWWRDSHCRGKHQLCIAVAAGLGTPGSQMIPNRRGGIGVNQAEH